MRTAALSLAALVLAALACRADDGSGLTTTQIEAMEKKGWITPDFEKAARELITAQETAQQASADRAKLESELPVLQKQADTENAKIAALKANLYILEHPEETDFTTLKDAMKWPNAAQNQLALAQAYVWTYPASPHAAEAERDLQQIEKKIADQVQAANNAAAAQEAGQLKILQGVKAHDLSLAQWRAFLGNKSQAEVRQALGEPGMKNDEYWNYSGPWTVDPVSNLKSSLEITFNGGRVQNVAAIPLR